MALSDRLVQQEALIFRARPLAAVMALAVFGVAQALSPAERSERMLLLLTLGLVLAGTYVVAARRFEIARVIRVALAVDLLLLTAMTAALEAPELLAIGSFWPIAVAAFLLGPVETMAYALAALVLIPVTPVAADEGVDWLVLVADEVAVLGVAGVLVLLSGRALTAERELRERSAQDEAALAISERIRSSLELEDVLERVCEELARSLDATHSIIRLAPREDGSAPVYAWRRPGTRPVEASIPGPIAEVIRHRRPLVVDDVEDEEREDVREMLFALELRAAVAFPVVWGETAVAVLGVADDRRRDWSTDALPLLDRLAPQIAAGIAHAELFAGKVEAIGRLEELSRMRQELLAAVSHELRTPITATLGFLKTLQRDDVSFPDVDRARFLELATSEAERLAHLVDDLITLVRLEHGVTRLQPAPVGLRRVVDRAVGVLRTPDEREVDISVSRELVVHADEGRLVQVVSNLVANAFLHGEGRVIVSATPVAGAVCLAVSDDGPGIAPDQAERLFVPFERWSEREGTGLGLAIARRIVEAHGGSLVYRPRAGLERHAFVVTLPVDAAAERTGRGEVLAHVDRAAVPGPRE